MTQQNKQTKQQQQRGPCKLLEIRYPFEGMPLLNENGNGLRCQGSCHKKTPDKL